MNFHFFLLHCRAFSSRKFAVFNLCGCKTAESSFRKGSGRFQTYVTYLTELKFTGRIR